MKRRHFLAALGGTAATWTFGVRAQQAALPIVGCLAAPAEATYAHQVASGSSGLEGLWTCRRAKLWFGVSVGGRPV